MIKFVEYSVPYCSTGNPAPLIEPQSAWNVGLGRRTGGLDLDVLQCRLQKQIVRWAGKRTKIRISRPRNIFWGGADHSPNKVGDTVSPCSTPSRRLLCLYSCARHGPLNQNPRSAPVCRLRKSVTGKLVHCRYQRAIFEEDSLSLKHCQPVM